MLCESFNEDNTRLVILNEPFSIQFEAMDNT